MHFGGAQHRTATVKNTYSPDWGEPFVFEVDDVSALPPPSGDGCLRVVLWDWDSMSDDERVGEAVVAPAPVLALAPLVAPGRVPAARGPL